MLPANNRAFKEWAVVCAALGSGEQTVLLRKGGIHEDRGRFTVETPEFFLLPTYEHQDAGLLDPQHAAALAAIEAEPRDPSIVTLSRYAQVDTVVTAASEEQVRAIAGEFIWNERYVRQRFDYNPYDPLYVMLLRVYRLPAPAAVLMRPAYAGCRSWVTLDEAVPTAGATPVLPDSEFDQRKGAVLARLES